MNAGQVFAWSASALVVGTIVTTFLIVGSPAEARRRRADDTRVERLQRLVTRIHDFYADKKKLPERLSQVGEADQSSYESYLDPATGLPFGYRALGPSRTSRYELSATFETDHPSDRYLSYDWQGQNAFAKHGKGLVSREFDAAKKS